MSIGPDIKEVLAEVGIAFTIDGGDTEYLTINSNTQITKPFIMEFFVEARLPYDTTAAVGNVLDFTVPGDSYLVMNKIPRLFENSIYQYDCVLYKCNVTVDVYRPREVRDPVSYLHRTIWDSVQAGVQCLLTTPLYGHDLETDEVLGLIGVEVHELYIPSSIGIRPLDRVRVSSSEVLRVETVKPRRYSAVDVVELGEDTRATTTTTTTTSTTTTTTSP